MIYAIVGLFFLLGLAIGSFINAAAYRLANKENIVTGRSHCVHCTYQLQVKDLVPIGSFLVLKGKCRQCKKPIPKDYFWVEVLTGLLFAFVGYQWFALGGSSDYLTILALVRDLIVVAVLVFLFVFDAKHYLLPDIVTLPAIVIVLIIQLLLGASINLLLIGAAVGGGFFLLQYVLSKGKWVGGGDIRLGVLMGVILGWPVIIPGLFLAYLIGMPVALYLLARGKKKMKSAIPFGTFLAISTLISMWWGQDIISWYVQYL